MASRSSEDARRRQDGDYEPPILTEPEGGPIPDPDDGEDDGE